MLLDTGSSYSSVNIARSALSSILLFDGVNFGELREVKLFMKGVFNIKPPQPRYVDIWDPSIVLELLRKWFPARKLCLKLLTMKLVMLILLTTGQRGQILQALNVDDMHISCRSVVFKISNLNVKQGRLGYKPNLVKLKAYAPDKRLCVFHYAIAYLNRTLDIRGTNKSFFITCTKPYKVPSRDTYSRWVRTVLSQAGINLGIFGPGSTRSAVTSKAASRNCPVNEIMRNAGWSQESTFTKWYKKEIENKCTMSDFVLK